MTSYSFKLPSDLYREIAKFLPPRDYVQFSTVSLKIRTHVGINVEQINLGVEIIREVQLIIPISCPSFRPGSSFVIAGSFAAFLAGMHLGIPNSHINFVFNDIDVFYQVYHDQFDDSDSEDWTSNYARTHREHIVVKGRRFEINWIPGACIGKLWRPFVRANGENSDFGAKDVVDTFDLSCVRVGFEVGMTITNRQQIRRYICPHFYDFLHSRIISLSIRVTDAYAQRSTAIRLSYKAMVLNAIDFKVEPLHWLLGKRRTTLQDGDISHSNAKKLGELRKANAPMPPWFKGLLLVKVRDSTRVGQQALSYTLVATNKKTYWGTVL